MRFWNTSVHVDFKSLYDAFFLLLCFIQAEEKKIKSKVSRELWYGLWNERMYDRMRISHTKRRKKKLDILSPTQPQPVLFPPYTFEKLMKRSLGQRASSSTRALFDVSFFELRLNSFPMGFPLPTVLLWRRVNICFSVMRFPYQHRRNL